MRGVEKDGSMARPEMAELLRRGETTLLAAMSPLPAVLQRGDILVPMGAEHEFLYEVTSGWLARSRTTPDGRRQIMIVFLPGEFCGIKTIFMTRQPDAIVALTQATARRIHFREACALAAQDFAVALHLARQLALDERHLHNWTLRLGRANAEERVAALLLELRHRLLLLGSNAGTRYVLPLTQEQIADHVGLTTVHVNRVLRRFREMRMVSIQRNEVFFQENVAALEELARPVQDLVGE
jgi:CRP/FNR family transcriptional regulator, anaerobic regulatory protein